MNIVVRFVDKVDNGLRHCGMVGTLLIACLVLLICVGFFGEEVGGYVMMGLLVLGGIVVTMSIPPTPKQ